MEWEAAIHGINLKKEKGIDLSKMSGKDAIAQMRAMGINVTENVEIKNTESDGNSKSKE